jgi:hypothetical protein
MAEHTVVYPKPGVTIFLPGGTFGFAAGPVPLRSDHAALLRAAGHVETEADRQPAAAKALPAAADAAAPPADKA